MRRTPQWIVALLLVGAALAPAAPATRPTKESRRVLIISVDGLRPDLMLRGDAPTLRRMLDEGTYTLWAQTTAVAVTVPSHVSMLTGARPNIHRIEWNHDLPLASPVYPMVPTLFELAKKAGYTTGLIAGKSKFDVLAKPGTLDVSWMPSAETVTNREVLGHALDVVNRGAPQVMVVHFPETDNVGHKLGWGSPEQMVAIREADAAIGTLLGTLASRGLLEQTLVIVTADHGGAGRRHGADDVRSRCIPWIAVGPGVRRGVDLTTVAPDRAVRTEDTFATACDFLGIAVDPALDGRPVLEAFDRRGQELMTAAPPLAPKPTAVAPVLTIAPVAAPSTRPAPAAVPATRPTDVVILDHAADDADIAGR